MYISFCKQCNKQRKTKHKTTKDTCRSCAAKNRSDIRVPWNKGRKLSDNHIEKLRFASTGKTHTKESKIKMSKARDGVPPWNKGIKIGPYSKEHRIAISCSKQNINIEDFKDFKQKDNERLRKQFNTAGLHKTCFIRDNYTCQICGKSGGTLNAHHIEPWNVNIELRFNINNLITLCVQCHHHFHDKYGYNCNSDDLKEYSNAF